MFPFTNNNMLLRFTIFLGFWLGGLPGPMSSCYAATPRVTEYQLKALYLYNFTKFITWPTEAFTTSDTQFLICILGEIPFNEELTTVVNNEKVKGRDVVVQVIDRIPMIKECHILFISRSKQPHLDKILQFARPGYTLTVSDMENFVSQGGMIQLYWQDNKLRFIIAPEIIEEVKLKANSQLLELAKIIRRPAGGNF